MTILIVEDNPLMRRMLRRTVLEIATTVWECSDGAEALSSYAEFLPDIVLMDVRMPVLDGLEATRRIIASFPLARIVMVTDYDDEDLRSAAAAAGACGYTLKEEMLELPTLLTLLLSERA